MSYAPSILVKKEDLASKKEFLTVSGIWESFGNFPKSLITMSDEDVEEVADYLKELLEGEVGTIADIELLLCEPEMSELNNNVRDVLSILGVDYCIFE